MVKHFRTHPLTTPVGGTAQSLVVNERFAYDHRGRLKTHWHRIGDTGTEVQLAEYAYDELGRETTRKLARTSGGAFAQTEDRAYTINGWLRSINDINGSGTGTGADIFALKLHYDEVLGGTGLSQTPQYTGNISALQWRTGQPDRPSPARPDGGPVQYLKFTAPSHFRHFRYVRYRIRCQRHQASANPYRRHAARLRGRYRLPGYERGIKEQLILA